MKPKYSPYQCNRCIEMDFSYFDHEVHRFCKGFNSALISMDIESLKIRRVQCKKFNYLKGSKKKSKFLDKAKYLARYPE